MTMRKASLQELRGRISAGKYKVDSSDLAADILSKFALVGRVKKLLVSEDRDTTPHPGPSESLRRATSAFGKKSPR